MAVLICRDLYTRASKEHNVSTMLGLNQTSSPLVIQLQEAAMDHRSSVSSLLTKAKVAAAKLRLGQLLSWIAFEINGYGNEEVPEYRTMSAIPKLLNPYNGMIPILGDDPKLMKLLGIARTGQSVAELEKLVEGKPQRLQMAFPPRLQAFVQQNMDLPIPMQGFWIIGSNQIEGILNIVRQNILDWSLELEDAGVLGQGLTFSATEKAAAMSVTNNFHGSNIGVFGSVTDHAAVTNNQGAVHSNIAQGDIRALVDQIQASQIHLPEAVQKDIARPLSTLKEQSAMSTPNQSTVAGALKSIKTVCEGASGNLIASGVTTMIANIMGN